MIDHGSDRGAFLGPIGGLIEFVHYKGSFKVDDDREITFNKTIGGGRFGFQEPATGLRSWDVSTNGLDSTQWAAFDLLRSGTYGNLHWWITPLAQVTNIISPRKSLPGNNGDTTGVTGDALAGGLVVTEGGLRVPSLVSGGGSAFVRCDVPVLSGVPVTVSAHVAGTSARVNAAFVDAAGKYLTSFSIGSTTSSNVKRVGSTLAPPAGAAAVYIGTYGATTIAAPAVTWTSEMTPWARGRGCENAVIHGISESEVDADPSYPQSDFSFMVTEVGDGA